MSICERESLNAFALIDSTGISPLLRES
jgi:hypothetical protein